MGSSGDGVFDHLHLPTSGSTGQGAHHLFQLQPDPPATPRSTGYAQRGRLVQDTTAALKIELLFLPADSPQFKLIERFWKRVKKCCLHAPNYPTFQDFKTSILHFIETAHVEKKRDSKIIAHC